MLDEASSKVESPDTPEEDNNRLFKELAKKQPVREKKPSVVPEILDDDSREVSCPDEVRSPSPKAKKEQPQIRWQGTRFEEF